MTTVPFLKSPLATIPGKRKRIKWATKLFIKKKGKGKKESAREIHSEKIFKFSLVGMREKQKRLFIYFQVVGKYAFFVALLC